jgi:hypothetical protein
MNIKKWYLENYSDDILANEIDENATFNGLFETLDNYENVYKYLGNDIDSIIRERVFEKLAEMLEMPYDYIYDQWLLAIN